MVEVDAIDHADGDIGLAGDVAGVGRGDGADMLTHMTQVAAAIDIARHTTFDIDVGGSGEGLQAVLVIHRAALAAAVDVAIHQAALQLYVGGAGHGGIFTEAAAVGIACDVAAVHEVHVGVVEVGIGDEVVGVGAVI